MTAAAAELECLKIPPHSIEAEQSVLGGLLLNNQAFAVVSDILDASGGDFYRRDHQLLYRAIQALLSNNQPADVITLSEFLENKGKLDLVGGLAYIGTIAKDTPSAANAKTYAQIVRENALKRGLVQVGTDTANLAWEQNGRPIRELLDQAQKWTMALGSRHQARAAVPLKMVLAQTVDRIDEAFNNDGPSGVSTGFSALDDILGGWQRSDMIILAARPSMGKTALVLQFAFNAVVATQKPVLFFSLEMPAEQLGFRFLSLLGRLNLKKLRDGALDDDDWPRLTAAISQSDQHNGNDLLLFDDTGGLSSMDLRARARRVQQEHGHLGLIVVDYLQLMRGSSKDNRNEEVSEISRDLKALAKELDTPVIALSQLNRGVENRENKRPKMADLRDSGAIEQDADVILFIYRDEVYNPDSEAKGLAELITAKQRNGALGTVMLRFQGQYTRFDDVDNKE